MIHNICRIWINCLACSPLEKDLIMKVLTNDAFVFVKDPIDNIAKLVEMWNICALASSLSIHMHKFMLF